MLFCLCYEHKGLDISAISLLAVLIGHGTVQKVFWGLNFQAEACQ